MQLGHLPRIKLTELPTPLEEMPRLTQALGGPKLLVKRDDLTAVGLGGNKVRKLEFMRALVFLTSALAKNAYFLFQN